MYILKNAFRCIFRAKGRNLLIGLVVLLLSVSACIGLSIKEANKTLERQYTDDMEITATVNPKNMLKNRNISLEKLNELADNALVKEFNYSASVYFAADEGIEPLDVAGSFKQNKDFREKYGDIKNGEQRSTTETRPAESSGNSSGESGFPGMPDGSSPGGESGGDTFITNNNFFFNMASMNDFTVIAYNDNDAMPEYISSLNAISSDTEDLKCVISKSLAEENELEAKSTFTLKNPDNEEEIYTFTVEGIFDSSQSTETQDTSSNASFTDNYIYVGKMALEKVLSESAKLNPEAEESDTEDDEKETAKALSTNYDGTFIFANLENYSKFSETLSEDYSLVSVDVENYEQSISQLATLGKYATYFLIVIFIIGAFVLVIINLFSIRNRKYEIGVLTAIGMKKYKVAMQFVTELFIVTFIALIIGSAVGGAVSVPVTNNLLVTINSEEKQETAESGTASKQQFGGMPSDMTPPGGFGENIKNAMGDFKGNMNNYIASVSSATDMTVIFQMILVGIGLTLISSAAAVAFVMRYEPLKILNNRD